MEKGRHPFLNDLSPDAELTGTVLKQPIKGRENIALIVNAVGSFYEEQCTIYIEQTARRTFLEYEADLHSGTILRAIVVIERDDEGLVSHVSVRVEPLGAALAIAENLGPIVHSLAN